MINQPSTTAGKWSVGLQAFFLIVIITSVVVVKVLKILIFDDHWWDVTVALAFPASIVAGIIGVVAVKKYEDRSAVVYLSLFVSVCTVLFILLHSLFISD